MTMIAPIDIRVIYCVETHKDMDIDSDIELVSSFDTYSTAFDYYEKLLDEAKGNYYITLEMEIDKEYDNEDYFSCERLMLANNYVDDIKTQTTLF